MAHSFAFGMWSFVIVTLQQGATAVNGELIAVLEYLHKEKGIDREILIQAVEASLLSACRKGVKHAKNLSVVVDRKTGKIRTFAEYLVVEVVQDPDAEWTPEKAKTVKPDAALGESVKVEVTPENFGRIAAQTAKQIIIQKIREAEREIVYNEYKNREGDLVTGIVRRYEHGNVIGDLGKTEAVLPYKEKCPTEDYAVGSRIRGLITSVKTSARGPEILLSRATTELVRKLFHLEVPEISGGTVEIKAIAREAGYRTKIAVWSADEKVDCVGACVGMRGSRVKNIVRELSGEKIDIVRWDEEIAKFVENALSPAKLREITVNDKDSSVLVKVEDDQLSLAIGKKGQNVRLTSKLTGWKVDVRKAGGEVTKEEVERKIFGIPQDIEQAKSILTNIPGIGPKTAKALVEAGFTDLAGLLAAEAGDLVKVPGIGEKSAKKILEAAAKFKKAHGKKSSAKSAKDDTSAQAGETVSAAEENPSPSATPQPETTGPQADEKGSQEKDNSPA